MTTMSERRFEHFAAQHKHLTVDAMLSKWQEEKSNGLYEAIVSESVLNDALHSIRVDHLSKFKELVETLLYYEHKPAKQHTAFTNVNHILIAEIGKYGRIEFLKYIIELHTDDADLNISTAILLAIKYEHYEFLRYVAKTPITDNMMDRQIDMALYDIIRSKRDYKEMFLFLKVIKILSEQTIIPLNYKLCPVKIIATKPKKNTVIKNDNKPVAKPHALIEIINYIYGYYEQSAYVSTIEDYERATAITAKNAHRYYIAISYNTTDSIDLQILVDYYENISIKIEHHDTKVIMAGDTLSASNSAIMSASNSATMSASATLSASNAPITEQEGEE